MNRCIRTRTSCARQPNQGKFASAGQRGRGRAEDRSPLLGCQSWHGMRSPASNRPSAGSLLRSAAVHGVVNCYAYEGKNGPHSGNEGREEKA